MKVTTAIDARRLAVKYLENLHKQGRLPGDWRNHAHVELLDAEE